MALNESIFKAYDIRGLYPQDINEENIIDIIKAIYTFLSKGGAGESLTVAVGRDMRVSSPALSKIAIETLIELGANVVDIGLVSTPTFYFAVLEYGYDAGIQISASHNPKEYNGIKYVRRVGKDLIKIARNTGMDEVKKIAISKQFISSKKRGTVQTNSKAVNDEVESAIKAILTAPVKKMRIVADPANAMGSLYIEKLFEKIPGNLIRMNFELDGTFPVHQPDPLQFDTLKELQERVVAEKADFGIAPDGDGDRVFFIDEKGNVIPATLITSLIITELLKENPGETILVDIRCIKNAGEVCLKNGGRLSISPVGHGLITEQLHKEKAIFAGESSGHYFFRETGGAESSIRVILYVLRALSRENKPISEILAPFMTWQESGEYNFVLESSEKTQSILSDLERFYQKQQISKFDGLSVENPDWRFNLRSSNTEPVLRLNLEARNMQIMNEKLTEVLQKLQSAGAVRK